MLGVGKALYRLRPDITYPGAYGCPITSADVDDDEWLPIVGRYGWAVLMRDKRVRTRPWERRAVLDHDILAFVSTTTGNSNNWDEMLLLVKHWDAIDGLTDAAPRPALYAVTWQGVKELTITARPGA